MKWKTPAEDKEPNLGDIKSRTIFALWPHRCTDGYTRWLEKVVKVLIYREQSGGSMEMPEYWNAWETKEYKSL